MVNTVDDLTDRGIGLKVLTREGTAIDTATALGRLVLGTFAALAAMGQTETKVGDLCAELGITRQALYPHVSPTGDLRADRQKPLSSK